VIKGDIHLLGTEIYHGLSDALVEQVQAFQKPDTGGAVNYGNIELYLGDSTFGKGDQFLFDLLFVQKLILVPEHGGLHLYSWSLFQIVVGVEFVFIQELVNGLASMATKGQIVPDYRM